MKELWKTITAFPDYAVSNCGRVKRITPGRGTRSGKILKGLVNKYGYAHVILSQNNKRKTCLVHRLVALEFISNPQHLPHINHRKPHQKANNRVMNLEWTTPKKNSKHAVVHGLMHKPHLKAKHIYPTKNGGWYVQVQGGYYGTFTTVKAARAQRNSILGGVSWLK